MIVIPVFWKQKHGEQQLIFDLAEEIVSDLRKGGVSCDSDTTNELTPGQKYRNWCVAGSAGWGPGAGGGSLGGGGGV